MFKKVGGGGGGSAPPLSKVGGQLPPPCPPFSYTTACTTKGVATIEAAEATACLSKSFSPSIACYSLDMTPNSHIICCVISIIRFQPLSAAPESFLTA